MISSSISNEQVTNNEIFDMINNITSLPSITAPIHTTTIPSTGQKIKFRPYLVKEEKVLLTAAQSGSMVDIINSVVFILKRCIIEDNFDVKKLTPCDVDWLWVQLTIKTVNNLSNIIYKHTDDKDYKLTIDLSKVVIKQPEEIVNPVAMISEDVGVTFKHLTLAEILNSEKSNGDDVVSDTIRLSIKNIFDKENVYQVADYTKEQLDEFVGNLSHKTLDHCNKFIESSPKVIYKAKVGDEEITLTGIENFFQ